MKIILACLCALLCFIAKAQDSTSFTGFVETYYSYDFNKPADNNRPNFLYSHNRHNEFNVNLAFIKASYVAASIRGNLSLSTGTYMNANYTAEPGVLKNIFEANAGVKIARNRNLWVDAGIFPSHIGFESAYSPSCATLTRSIIADNSPYYESGVKITYTSNNNKWLLSALALNGWQRIQRLPGNSAMSWGTQISFTTASSTLNYSTFIGTDKPDSARQWRQFHNFYGIFNLSNRLHLTLGFDIGKEAGKTWYGTAGILQYTFPKNWAFAVRAEYYNDEKGVLNSVKTSGFSLNIDRRLFERLLWRTEVRTFDYNNNTAITTSLAINF